MTTRAFPVCSEDLSNEWLTDIINKSDVYEDVTVTNFAVSPIGDPGLSSTVVRIKLEYEKNSSEAPSSLIGKFPTAYEQTRTMAQTGGAYLKEVQFYKFIAPGTGDLVPKCFAAEIDTETHDFVLILEDLSELRFSDHSVIGKFSEYSGIMLENIAPFHAKWWGHPDLETFDWIPHPQKESSRETQARGINMLKMTLPVVKQKFRNYMTDNAWSVIEKFANTLEEISEFSRKFSRLPMTLNHGDYHYLQCFFPSGSNDRFAVIDWQGVCIGAPAIDVARTLLFDPKERRIYEESLVANYHSLLLENGVKNYPIEQLWNNIQLSALRASITYVIAIAMTDNEIFKAKAAEFNMDPYEYLLTWLGSALDDWEVDAALDRLLQIVRSLSAAS